MTQDEGDTALGSRSSADDLANQRQSGMVHLRFFRLKWSGMIPIKRQSSDRACEGKLVRDGAGLMRKQVVIHFGYHKTGSSALQAAFALHADKLARAGIAYPYPDSPATVARGACSGNIIQWLYKGGFMKGFDAQHEHASERFTPDFFKCLADMVASQREQRVLLSGEIFGVLTEAQIMMLQEAMAHRHDVQIFCFVRDPFDFAYSCWKQVAKSSGLNHGFDVYLAERISTARGLSMLGQFPALDRSGLAVTVLRYESHRKAIAQGFMAALGWMSPEECAGISAPKDANPSVNGVHALMATQLRAGGCEKGLADVFLRNALMKAPSKSDAYYNRRQHRLILDSFRESIARINQYLPPNEKLSMTERDAPDVEMVSSLEDLKILAEAVKYYLQIRETANLQRNPVHRVINKLRWPALPTRFNPQAYLFLNPDVAGTGMSPQKHYRLHGRAEGRRRAPDF